MPKLVCDKPPEGQDIDYYTIAGLPGDPKVPPSDHPEYGVEIDVSDLPPGTYSVRLSACQDTWGCSLPTPLDFTVPEKPSPPTGLAII